MWAFYSTLTCCTQQNTEEMNLGVVEAFTEQDDLGNQRGIGNHHRDRAKHGFEIIGQLGSSGISGIHRDEDTT